MKRRVGMPSMPTRVSSESLTHSRHIQLSGGSMVGFSTFMTGELYALLEAATDKAEAIANTLEGVLLKYA